MNANLYFRFPYIAKEENIKKSEEKAVWLALIPVMATGLFYLLPLVFQQNRLIQFIPQISSYIAMSLWCFKNSSVLKQLGLQANGFISGIRFGVILGLLLGGFNASVILWGVPSVGGDILFLKDTPHAQVPTWIMVPWGILLIAMGVELNFRGFLLGRLEALCVDWLCGAPRFALYAGQIFAVALSSLVFAFDPFMVTIFRHLHWIAVWDGLVWGWFFIRKRNLYMIIIAHAVEVVILYLSMNVALT
ncbi:MAG: CPBP family glutamic-type intramembrane protease [Nitrospirota bacterium]|nr:CPBP family glutamic-type intramembrane protease [Nitrospirota bacterium]